MQIGIFEVPVLAGYVWTITVTHTLSNGERSTYCLKYNDFEAFKNGLQDAEKLRRPVVTFRGHKETNSITKNTI